MLRVARHGHAPIETGARNRKIVQPALDEAHHLIAAGFGRDKIGMRVVIGQEPVLPGGELEEVIFLFDPFDVRAGRRLAADQLALFVERLVAHRIPALETAEIDLAAFLQFPPQRLARLDVARFGGADELVVGDVHQLGHGAEILRYAVAEFLRRHARVARRFRHLLTMLVGAGEKQDPAPIEPHEPRQRVARHRGIGMAQMRRIIDVVDRRGDVERLAAGHLIILERKGSARRFFEREEGVDHDLLAVELDALCRREEMADFPPNLHPLVEAAPRR